MKSKKQELDSEVPNEVADLANFEWPPLFERDEVHLLVQRVLEAANDEAERQIFAAILRRAYEDVMELEILYRELPQLFKGDRSAVKYFTENLEL